MGRLREKMRHFIQFLNTIFVIHVSSCLWWGLIGTIAQPENKLEGFVKGATLMPIFFGNFIYLGCLVFSSLGVYFFVAEKK